LNVVNSGTCNNSPASKMNLAFIPSKPVALFLYSFFNALSSSTSVIFVFRVWLMEVRSPKRNDQFVVIWVAETSQLACESLPKA
jgi:hypothetical protein